jgi:hypothetical protein
MGRRFVQPCCCARKTLYPFVAGYTPTATDDRFDVNASFVSLARPREGQGATIYYSSPPTGYHLESIARVKVFDDVEATLTARLVARQMPAEWFPRAYINDNGRGNGTNFDYLFNASADGVALHPFGEIYAQDINQCITPASIVKQSYNGTMVYGIVVAVTDFPEPERYSSTVVFPAKQGAAIGEFFAPERAGLSSIVLYCEDMQIRTRPSVGFVDGGWITSPYPASWPDSNFKIPAQTFGYDSSFFLSLSGQSRWVNVGGNELPALYATYPNADPNVIPPNTRRKANHRVSLSSYFDKDAPCDTRQTGFFTAYTERQTALPAFQANSSRKIFSAAYPVNSLLITYASGRNALAYYGYTNKEIQQFVGNTVTVYKNGSSVLSANYPTVAQSLAVTQDEGTYFVVDQITGATDDPSKPTWYQRDQFAVGWHKQFDCVVIDKTPPVVAFSAIDDFFGNPSLNYAFPAAVIATEPLHPNYGPPVYDLDDSGILVAGFYPYNLTRSPASGAVRQLSMPASATIDYAGNAASHSMTQSVKIVSPPQRFLLTGAKPSLEQFERRTLRQSERVATVRLTFDRKIDPAGVSVSQFTLKKNNTTIGGLTIEPIGDGSREWLVRVPLDAQASRSFFLLEYDSGGNVFTDDIEIYRATSRDSFPATGKYKTKYVYADREGVDQWFSWSPSGYARISANDFPLYPFGGNYEPERCLLAARTSWLMADEAGRPRMIDCSSFRYDPRGEGDFSAIGRVASLDITKEVDVTETTSEAESNEPGMPAFTYTSIGATYQRSDEIHYKGYKNTRGFVPAVPSPSSPNAPYSYWRLTTTIDPSPPAAVHPCAAAMVHQKHSSVIISDNEITGFKVALEWRNADGSIKTDFSNEKLTFGNDQAVQGGGTGSFTQKGFAERIMAISGREYTFGTTLEGRPLSQNVWGCIDGATGGQLQTTVAKSGLLETVRCASENKDYYRVFMNTPGGVDFSRGFFSGMSRSASSVFEQDGAQAILSVARDFLTYPALMTTTLGNLVIALSLRMCVKRTTTYTEYKLSGNPDAYAIGTGYNVNLDPCPSNTDRYVQPGSPLAGNTALYEKSRMQQVATKTTVGRFFDCVSGAIVLSRLEELSLGTGGVIRKEFPLPGGIWTLRIQRV